jgi:hypothetical protein
VLQTGLITIISLFLLSGCVTEYYTEENPFLRSKPHGISYKNRYDTGVLQIGMTEKDIKQRWGLPSQITKAVTEYESFEQWEYCDSYSAGSGTCESYKYLYFGNGKLNGWSE